MARVDSTITLKHRDPSDPDHPQRNAPIRGYKMFLAILGTVHFFIREGGREVEGRGVLGKYHLKIAGPNHMAPILG